MQHHLTQNYQIRHGNTHTEKRVFRRADTPLHLHAQMRRESRGLSVIAELVSDATAELQQQRRHGRAPYTYSRYITHRSIFYKRCRFCNYTESMPMSIDLNLFHLFVCVCCQFLCPNICYNLLIISFKHNTHKWFCQTVFSWS